MILYTRSMVAQITANGVGDKNSPYSLRIHAGRIFAVINMSIQIDATIAFTITDKNRP